MSKCVVPWIVTQVLDSVADATRRTYVWNDNVRLERGFGRRSRERPFSFPFKVIGRQRSCVSKQSGVQTLYTRHITSLVLTIRSPWLFCPISFKAVLRAAHRILAANRQSRQRTAAGDNDDHRVR